MLLDLSKDRIDTLASSSSSSRLSNTSSSSSGSNVVSERRKVKAQDHDHSSASSASSGSAASNSVNTSDSSTSGVIGISGSVMVGLYADDEAMALTAFKLFTLTYTEWNSSPSTRALPPMPLDPSTRAVPILGPFNGPFLAHTAQLALSFAMHRSKHIATAALR